MNRPDLQSAPKYINVWYVGVALLLLMLFQSWWISQQQTTALDYSEFQSLMEDG